MSLCSEYFVLPGRGLCDELITRPEVSYYIFCDVVSDLETSITKGPMPALGRSATRKINILSAKLSIFIEIFEDRNIYKYTRYLTVQLLLHRIKNTAPLYQVKIF
jgi:hypothetical protein